jgi:hypothetical protein
VGCWWTFGALALSSGCAVTTTTCPLGTKLVGAQQPQGHVQWCATSDATTTALPVAGRSFAGTLGGPTAMPGGIEGPFTSWYATGAIESHGSYVNTGARSVPEGTWGFWYPDGRRRTLGVYHRGLPEGCFAVWDEHGTRSTGFVDGEQLRVEACAPPPDDDLRVAEGREQPEEGTAWGDISLQGFAGPNKIGASNAGQVEPDPGMTFAFSASARRRIGRLRVGPVVGVRVADSTNYFAYDGGATIGWELPSFHPRIDAEVSAELGVQHTSVTAIRSTQPGSASLAFWSPLPAVQIGFAFALSPNIEALLAVRADGVPTRNVDRDVVYCDLGCAAPVQETWQIGGLAYGVNLGLRLVIR